MSNGGGSDPFAGADSARDALSAVTERLQNDPGLSDDEAAACETIIRSVVNRSAGVQDKVAAGLALADKVAGFVKNPATLLSLVGL